MNASQPSLLPLLSSTLPASRVAELLEFAPDTSADDEDVVFWVVRLAHWLRPSRGKKFAPRLRFLAERLAQNPLWEARVGAALSRLVRMIDLDGFFSHAGIARDFHFSGALSEWFRARVLPQACKTDDGAQIARLAFEASDAEWLRSPALMDLLSKLLDGQAKGALLEALDRSLIDLAHQVIAQAQAPNVRRLLPRDASPFPQLFEAVAAHAAASRDTRTLRELRGRLRACETFLEAYREQLCRRGADLNTTFQLNRSKEQLSRLALLAGLRTNMNLANIGGAFATIVAKVSRGESAQRLFLRSADLVAQNLVDTAASVGRRYLGDETSSFGAALRAGMGGGALMAVAAVLKFMIARLHLSPFYEGLAFAANYSVAFCAAFLLHYTIATKLPAHTAAALAQAAQDGPSHGTRLRAFLVVWRTALRLQIAGLVGNLVVAGPLALLIDLSVKHVTGSHLLTEAKAHHVLVSQSILGPSALFAAITGVFLWISSLTSAASENWIREVGLVDRLSTNRQAMAHIGHRARARAERFLAPASGLIGNITLGLLLGVVPAAFAILRIPLEIRHITVSTSSVALALSAGGGSGTNVCLALMGLVSIAAVNVGVSFVLALVLAFRTRRGLTASSSTAIARIGLRRHPLGVARSSRRIPSLRTVEDRAS